MLRLVQTFESASGQKVNVLKSSVFFSSDVKSQERAQLCSSLNMEEAGDDCNYLGLPNMIKKSKVATLVFKRIRSKREFKAGMEDSFLKEEERY